MLKFNEGNQSFVLYTHDIERAEKAGLTLSTTVRGPQGERVYFTADQKMQPTFNPYAVLEYYNEADTEAQAKLQPLADDYQRSWADDDAYEPPCPDGKAYLPYQRAGITYALNRTHCIIGDEPGLGKTIQAIGIANALGARRILVVCPASIRLNWCREIRGWSTIEDVTARAILTSKDDQLKVRIDNAHYIVISYDLLRNKEVHDLLRKIVWDLAILDEAHYLKTRDAQRTRAIFGGGAVGTKFFENGLDRNIKRMVGMTGTPLPNRPRECLGSNTLVLTDRGWERMIDIRITDKVWDGIEWVEHNGIEFQGIKKVKNLAGISVTGDHLFLGKSSWVSAEEACQSMDIWSQILEKGLANLPSSAWSTASLDRAKGSRFSVLAVIPNLLRRFKECVVADLVNVESVELPTYLKNTWMFVQTTVSEAVPSPSLRAQFNVVTTLITNTMPPMVEGVSHFMKYGSRIGANVWSTLSRLKASVIPLYSLTGLTTAGDMSPVIYDGQAAKRIWGTAERYTKCNRELIGLKPVYDIVNAGPRQRFTILSNDGPIISHNCYTISRGLDWASIDYLSEEAFLFRYNPTLTYRSGHSDEDKGRLPELNARLRCNLMVRRLKKDVLPQLPDKRYEMTYVEEDGAIREVLAKEALIDFDPDDLFNGDFTMDGTPISTLRREMGEAMVARIIEYMRYMFDVVEYPKVILYAHHKTVISELMMGLAHYNPVVHKGGMNTEQKEESKKSFIEDDHVRLFIAQLDTMEGVDGLQSVCSDVVFGEPAWNPGRNEQCVDRTHRIGQHENVIAHFLLAKGSFNEKVLNVVLAKAEDIHAVMDRKVMDNGTAT